MHSKWKLIKCAGRKKKKFKFSLGEGGLLGLNFARYVLLASQNPYPIKVYYVAKYRPHPILYSHFWENVIFVIPT